MLIRSITIALKPHHGVSRFQAPLSARPTLSRHATRVSVAASTLRQYRTFGIATNLLATAALPGLRKRATFIADLSTRPVAGSEGAIALFCPLPLLANRKSQMRQLLRQVPGHSVISV